MSDPTGYQPFEGDPHTESPLVLLTLSYAKQHLRIDGEAENEWLALAIAGVSRSISRWCGGDDRLLDEDGDLHSDVRLAALVELAYLYRWRHGPEFNYLVDWAGRGYPLSPGAVAILQPFHKPVVA